MPLIDPARIKPLLGTLAGRFDVDSLDACDSTSSELLRRADRGAPGGTVLVADEQTAGRGRRGRAWLSAPADSLTAGGVLGQLPTEADGYDAAAPLLGAESPASVLLLRSLSGCCSACSAVTASGGQSGKGKGAAGKGGETADKATA